MGDFGPRLSDAKPKLSEQALTLTHSECNIPLVSDKLRESLAIPKIAEEPEICRTLPESQVNFAQLFLTEPSRPSEPFSFSETNKAFLFEPTHPVGNGSRSVSKEFCNLSAAQALGHKENSVQSVIVAGFIRASDFVLKGEHHIFTVGKFCSSHSGISIPPWTSMRNYL
jgi:hypothetical protein